MMESSKPHFTTSFFIPFSDLMKGMARPFRLMKHSGHWGGERMEELEYGVVGILAWGALMITPFIFLAGLANMFTPGSENQGQLMMICSAVSFSLSAMYVVNKRETALTNRSDSSKP